MNYSYFTDALQLDRRYNLLTNTTLLLTHILFIFLYIRMQTPILFYYNLGSVATFLANYYFVWRDRKKAFLIVIYAEVFLFTTLNLLLLGWGYGFELYCFSYAISIQMVSFALVQEKHAKQFFLAVGVFILLYFLGMRLLLYKVPARYPVRDPALQHGLYLSNGTLSLLLSVYYVGLFTKIVYSLASDLHYSSTHDALTDLYNRRHMWEIMNAAKQGGAVAMLDIDDFKRINDTYGHAAGDAVLKALAEQLKALESEGLVISRWGGEEFVLFCGGNTRAYDHLEALLNDFIHTCRERPVPIEDGEIRFTVTMGLMYASGETGIHALVSAADELLYEGKQSGKNRLVVGRL